MSSDGTVTPTSPTFKRAVSRWEIVGLAVNDVVGSGVYLLPAAAAAILGPMSVWAVVVAGFAVFLLVLCFSEAASYFDRPGGAYLYTREAFGDLVGFEVGWMTWVARVASVASLSVGFANALSRFWPATAEIGGAREAAIVVPLLGLTLINVLGVKSGARTAVLLAVAKVVPLLLFIGVGFFYVSWSTATDASQPTQGTLGEAALLLLFAYAGFENTPAPAGEFKNPRRDVPFALLAQLAIVTLLYTAVQWVALGTLPGLAGSETPLADAADLFLGPAGVILLTVGAAVSILGTNGNTVLAGPRYLFALADDGFGPRALARLHPRFRTPVAAILLQTAIAVPLALNGTFVELAKLSVIARLATYIGTAMAVPVLRRKHPDVEKAVRLPLGPVIPIAATLLCLVLAASARPEQLKMGLYAILLGFLIYAFRREPAGGGGATSA